VESAPEGVWYVDPGKSGDGTGLENRIRDHPAGCVGRRRWAGDLGEGGDYCLAAEIFIGKPVALYGGFAGNERAREKRDWRKRPTLLDAPDLGRCLSLAADGVRISGFVFSFGNNSNGGAVMALPLSRFMIEDCLFEANSASLGGGLYSKNAAGTVNGCEFSGNTAKTKGGAVYADSSALTITNCVFSANTAGAAASAQPGAGRSSSRAPASPSSTALSTTTAPAIRQTAAAPSITISPPPSLPTAFSGATPRPSAAGAQPFFHGHGDHPLRHRPDGV